MKNVKNPVDARFEKFLKKLSERLKEKRHHDTIKKQAKP